MANSAHRILYLNCPSTIRSKVRATVRSHAMESTVVSAPAILTQTLHKLVEAEYLQPSTVISHLSPRDKRLRYEAEEKRKISGFPTAKELHEAKEVAGARLKREEEEARQIGMVSFPHYEIESRR